MSGQPLGRYASKRVAGAGFQTPVAEDLETRFYAEDGWVFRERPGKPVECVARYTGPIYQGLMTQAGREAPRGDPTGNVLFL